MFFFRAAFRRGALLCLLLCLSHSLCAEVIQGSIRDFVLRALEQNQELEVQRLSPEIQQEVLRGAWGKFSPVFVAEGMNEEKETNVDQRTFNALYSSLFGPQDPTSIYNENNTMYKVGIEGVLPIGTQYQLSLLNRELNNDTNTFDTEYAAEGVLQLTQPILRGFGKDAALAEVRLAKSDLKREEFRLESMVNRVLQETMSTCVEMIFAQNNLEVKRESVALAKELLEDNRKGFELGRLNEIDVLQAEARVSEAKEEELQAKTFLIERTNDLKVLISSDFEAVADSDIEVVDELNTDYDLPSKLDLIAAALENNADFQAAREHVRAQELRLDMAENSLRPQLDLIASLSYNGLSFDGGLNAIKDFENRDEASWSLGFSFSYPLGNQTAKAMKRKAFLQKRQAEKNVSFSKMRLSAQLDSAIQVVQIAKARIETSEATVALAEKSLEAELKRLKLGSTTSYNVAEMQRNLSVARTRNLAAVVEYEKAMITLWGIVGILKERMNLTVKGRDV